MVGTRLDPGVGQKLTTTEA